MTPHISTMGFGFEGATAGQKLVRCAIYTRFSSDMQRLTSTEDQIRECRDAAKRNGWVILDEYIFSDEAALHNSAFSLAALGFVTRVNKPASAQ